MNCVYFLFYFSAYALPSMESFFNINIKYCHVVGYVPENAYYHSLTHCTAYFAYYTMGVESGKCSKCSR